MWKLKDNDYELLHDGVSYGYLPKVGSKGYLIHYNLYDGGWRFKTTLPAAGWFQTWGKDGNDYDWFHGCVDETGKITQIG